MAELLRLPDAGSPLPQKITVASTVLTPAPIPSGDVLAGNPTASSSPLVCSSDDGFSAALWTCTPGSFRWFYASDEIIHILEGEVRVVSDHGGAPLEFVGGDVVYFPRGTSAVWEIRKTIRKIAILRSNTADPLGRLRGALTRRGD